MLADDKQALRRTVRQLKKMVPQDRLLRASAAGLAQLETHPRWRTARTVCLYWALPDEVQTQSLCLKAMLDRTVLLPVVQGEELALRQLTDERQLSDRNALHIFEPAGDDWTDWPAVDLVVVPGMAFDKAGHRLGRGRGFYDRLLPHLDAYKIGLCFDFQYVGHVPSGAEDVLMDDVIVCPGPLL